MQTIWTGTFRLSCVDEAQPGARRVGRIKKGLDLTWELLTSDSDNGSQDSCTVPVSDQEIFWTFRSIKIIGTYFCTQCSVLQRELTSFILSTKSSGDSICWMWEITICESNFPHGPRVYLIRFAQREYRNFYLLDHGSLLLSIGECRQIFTQYITPFDGP